MTQEQIIDRVKKLLELANSPNEHEAKLAFQRAQQLTSKYSIDLSGEGKEEKILESPYNPPFKLPKEPTISILNTVAKIFSCHAYIMVPVQNLAIFGFETNIKVTRYATDSVLNQLHIDYKREYKKHRSIAFGDAFWKGTAKAFKEKFKQESESGTGIILYDKIQSYADSKYGQAQPVDLGVHDSDYQDAFAAGKAAGSEATIRSGVTSSQKGNLLK